MKSTHACKQLATEMPNMYTERSEKFFMLNIMLKLRASHSSDFYKLRNPTLIQGTYESLDVFGNQ